MRYTDRVAGTSLQAFSGNNGAGAGTVFLQDVDEPGSDGELIIDGGTTTAGSPLPTDDGSFDRVTVNGGALHVDSGVLSTMELVVTGGATFVTGGPAVMTGMTTLSGGTLQADADLTFSPGMLSMSGGTFVNNGTLQLDVFDGSNVSAGAFYNRGTLSIGHSPAQEVLTVVAGVELTESGKLGPRDSIQTLNLAGTILHDLHDEGGVSFTVRGDATIESGGLINTNGRGLYGSRRGTNTTDRGESYDSNWNITTAAGAASRAGGSHGGRGQDYNANASGPIYGSPTAPVRLGSGGGGCCGAVAGSGGGRVDLVVGGTLTVDGMIRADGGNGANSSAGASGGSVRLRVDTLTGSGIVRANGGFGERHGGGGRISIEARVDTGTVTAEASGGNAQAGTIHRALPSVLTVPDLQSSAYAACHLSDQGLLTCWGDDSSGLVSEAPAGHYVRLVMGSEVACALHAEGYAHCWGDPGAGNPGILDEPLLELSELGVGRDVACGLLESDGAVVCWGDPAAPVAINRPSGPGFLAIWLTDDAACAQGPDGTLSCWGAAGDLEADNAPLSPISIADAGEQLLCAVMSDGSISCWGDTNLAEPTPSGSNYVGISAGTRHACAVDALGEGVCWGDDTDGQSTPPSGSSFDAIAAGGAHSCGLVTDGTLSCWGDVTSPVVTGAP